MPNTFPYRRAVSLSPAMMMTADDSARDWGSGLFAAYIREMLKQNTGEKLNHVKIVDSKILTLHICLLPSLTQAVVSSPSQLAVAVSVFKTPSARPHPPESSLGLVFHHDCAAQIPVASTVSSKLTLYYNYPLCTNRKTLPVCVQTETAGVIQADLSWLCLPSLLFLFIYCFWRQGFSM